MPNIIEITDFHAPELDIYARYTEGQLLNRHEPEKALEPGRTGEGDLYCGESAGDRKSLGWRLSADLDSGGGSPGRTPGEGDHQAV